MSLGQRCVLFRGNEAYLINGYRLLKGFMYNQNKISLEEVKLMRDLRKLLSSAVVAGLVLTTFSTGVSAGRYKADEPGLKDVTINANTFPDATFREFVKSEYDVNKDGILSLDECQYIEDMDVSGKGIKDLKGIEYFQGLFELDCSDNSLSRIDLTLNFNMQRLDISGNNITSIEIGTMPLIERAYHKFPKTVKGSVDRYIGNYGAKDFNDDGTVYFIFDSAVTVSDDWKIGWQSDAGGYWFKKADGSYFRNCGKQIGGEWYYFDNSGYLVADKWVYTDGRWYYFEFDNMVANGWTEIGGKYYYFSGRDWEESGTQTDRGMQVGFQRIKSSNEWRWYYFNAGGAMQTGWVAVGGKWYYFDTKYGQMLTGWQNVGGKYYYMLPADEGSLLSSPNNGYMVANRWLQIGDYWYYFNAGGDVAVGWKLINNKWYYFNDLGRMVTGWQQIGGRYYFFKDGGDMANGWLYDGGYWYYMDNGCLTTGWKGINGKWYYFNELGRMTTGWQLIGGSYYFFKASGEMAQGWVADNGYWYNMNNSGSMYEGWLVQGNNVYFLAPDFLGRMIANSWWEINGEWYEFDANGVCKNPPSNLT